VEQLDAQLLITNQILEYRRQVEGKEINEGVRAKAMQLKWREWEDLSKKRLRLQAKIQAMKIQ